MNREKITKAKRIVIKIGTHSLIDESRHVQFRRIDRLAYVISTLKQQGKEVVLVTSGAMGVGCAKLNLPRRPKSISDQQAVSAVGQVELMNLYARFFAYYNEHVAQILMTRDVIDFPESLDNIKGAFDKLLKRNIVPVVNENDAVAVDELDHHITFGDNDTLSALVCNIVSGDLLILLTDVDGFYDSNPHKYSNAQRFDVITEISKDIKAMGGEADGTFSTGGMSTKLIAADTLLKEQRSTVIMSSQEPSDIFSLLEGKDIGTAFIPKN